MEGKRLKTEDIPQLMKEWELQDAWAMEAKDPDERWGRMIENQRKRLGEEGEEERRIPMKKAEMDAICLEINRQCWEAGIVHRDEKVGEENMMALGGMERWIASRYAMMGYHIAKQDAPFELRMGTAIHMFGSRPIVNWGHRGVIQVATRKVADNEGNVVTKEDETTDAIITWPTFAESQEWEGKHELRLFEMLLYEMNGVGWGGFYMGMWERGELEEALKLDEGEWKDSEKLKMYGADGYEDFYLDHKTQKLRMEAWPAAKEMLHAMLILKKEAKGFRIWDALRRQQLWGVEWVLGLLAKEMGKTVEELMQINWNNDSGQYYLNTEEEDPKENRAKGKLYWDMMDYPKATMKDDGDLEAEDAEGKARAGIK